MSLRNKSAGMFKSFSFDGDNGRTGSPIQRLWRYLSTTELSGYRSEVCLPTIEIVDNGHPLGLGNPTIIRNILSHLPPSDLIQVRRVSLRWNHVACEFLRKELGPCQLRPSKIKQFLKVMKRSFCNPFRSYAIRIENMNDLHIKNFFRRFSLDITKLRVKISSDEIPEFLNRLLNKLPNLEELHLIRIPEGSLSLRTEYRPPSAWHFGVFHFPKLKTIHLESDNPSIPFIRNFDHCLVEVINSSPNLVKILFENWDSHLSRLVGRCGISNPKSFDGWKFANSNPKLKQDLIELFYDSKIKFKAIKFTIDDRVSFELVQDLTLQTAESLYHISLRNSDPTEVFVVSLQLHRLLTLGLQGWRGPVDFYMMKNSNQFPSLKTLKLNPSNFSDPNFKNNHYPLEGYLLDTLETLTVMPLDGLECNPVNEDLMRRLVKMFPSIRELYVQIEGNETLHVVYEYWPKLTLLCVDLRGDEIGDEAFTGIPQDCIQYTGHWECGCSQIAFSDERRRSTFVGSLSGLQTLILRTGRITDISLIEGISCLKNLETLWLLPSLDTSGLKECEGDNEPKFRLTPKPWCLRAIAESLRKLRHLVTSHEVCYSEEDSNYLRECLPGLQHETKD